MEMTENVEKYTTMATKGKIPRYGEILQTLKKQYD